jgi:hypothetical protein
VTESPKISAQKNRPPSEGPLILASVRLDGNGYIADIDSSMRRYSAPGLGLGSVTTEELANEAVTEIKLSPELRARLGGARGWVRLTFKPVTLERVIFDRQSERVTDTVPERGPGFICDVSFARCGTAGARGTMTIPVPAGARSIRAFRIYGQTQGSVEVELIRGGWDRRQNGPIETSLFQERVTVGTGGAFDWQRSVHQQVNEDQSLAVKVVAQGDSKIWFVAAEFE